MLTVALAFVLANVIPVAARTFVIDAGTSNSAPKAALEQLIADFQAENPDIKVELNL